MAEAAIAALESVYAAGAQTPCYRYEKEPGDAYASSPRLRQGAAAEVVAANKLVVGPVRAPDILSPRSQALSLHDAIKAASAAPSPTPDPTRPP